MHYPNGFFYLGNCWDIVLCLCLGFSSDLSFRWDFDVCLYSGLGLSSGYVVWVNAYPVRHERQGTLVPCLIAKVKA